MATIKQSDWLNNTLPKGVTSSDFYSEAAKAFKEGPGLVPQEGDWEFWSEIIPGEKWDYGGENKGEIADALSWGWRPKNPEGALSGSGTLMTAEEAGEMAPVWNQEYTDTWKKWEEAAKNSSWFNEGSGEIAEQKPGQSPGDDRSKEPYDKDWPPPAPLKKPVELASLALSELGFGDEDQQDAAQTVENALQTWGIVNQREQEQAADAADSWLVADDFKRQAPSNWGPMYIDEHGFVDNSVEPLPKDERNTRQKVTDFFEKYVAAVPGNVSSILQPADEYIKALGQTAGLTNYTEDNPMNISMDHGTKVRTAETVNKWLNAQTPERKAFFLAGGQPTIEELGEGTEPGSLNKALQDAMGKRYTSQGTYIGPSAYHLTMNNLAHGPNVFRGIKEGPDGQLQVQGIGDNYQFVSDSDITAFNWALKPAQRLAMRIGEMTGAYDTRNPLKAKYEMDQNLWGGESGPTLEKDDIRGANTIRTPASLDLSNVYNATKAKGVAGTKAQTTRKPVSAPRKAPTNTNWTSALSLNLKKTGSLFGLNL